MRTSEGKIDFNGLTIDFNGIFSKRPQRHAIHHLLTLFMSISLPLPKFKNLRGAFQRRFDSLQNTKPNWLGFVCGYSVIFGSALEARGSLPLHAHQLPVYLFHSEIPTQNVTTLGKISTRYLQVSSTRLQDALFDPKPNRLPSLRRNISKLGKPTQTCRHYLTAVYLVFPEVPGVCEVFPSLQPAGSLFKLPRDSRAAANSRKVPATLLLVGFYQNNRKIGQICALTWFSA
ncbi:hypothetical protein B0H11DRAFT_1934975 [Mycena galericulata]|nr:hypothetical protein B0H11DRAFT_1934975 [Mycena galericulata]